MVKIIERIYSPVGKAIQREASDNLASLKGQRLLFDDLDAQHVEACREHIKVGVRISLSGAARLIKIIDRLRARG